MGRNSLKQLLRSLGVAPGVAVLTLVASGSPATAGAQTVSFIARRDFATGPSPTSVAVGDFNGDGVQDLAVANQLSNDVSVLINNTPTPPTKVLGSPLRPTRANK